MNDFASMRVAGYKRGVLCMRVYAIERMRLHLESLRLRDRQQESKVTDRDEAAFNVSGEPNF